MKQKLFIFSFLLLAIACSSDEGNATTRKTQLKVMSFNIRYLNAIDLDDLSWAARKEPCMKLIRDIAPDVIGMQEPRAAQCEDIAEALPEYHQIRILESEEISAAQTGSALLLFRKDKYALLDSGHYWLSATPDVPSYPWAASDHQYRVAIWAHLKDNATQQEFFFFTTHLPYKTEPTDNEARLECVRLNVEKMKAIAGRHVPVFITGDMNASYATSDTRRECLVPFYEWLWAGRDTAPDTDAAYSYNGFGKSTPKATWNIDHIFYRQAMPLQFRTIVSPDYGVTYVSDHYPIVCTFQIL